jgi:hypothetical protein
MLATIQTSPHLVAGVFLVSESLAMGLYMSFAFRLKALTGKRDDVKAMLDGKAFKVAHSVQLNNAE